MTIGSKGVGIRPLMVGLTFAVAMSASSVAGEPASADAPCSVEAFVFGQAVSLTGPTPTDWIQVFGFGLSPSHRWTLTFSRPMYMWPIPNPSTMPVTRYVMAPNPSGGFKWDVRTRDVGVDTVRYSVSDGRCTASMTIALAPNTATEPAPGPNPGAPWPLWVTVVAVLTVLLARFRPERRAARDIREH